MNKIKLLFWLINLCLPFVLNAQNNIGDHGVQWRNDLTWSEIKTLAKQKGMNIFLDCYATWCGPCKMMDKQVYSSDSIAGYFNKNFISVRLQVDTTSHDNETVKKWFAFADQVKTRYGITSLPTLMFLSPDDTLLDKRIGYQTVQNLLATAQAIPSKIHLYNQLKEYKKGKKDYSVMPELADFAKKVMGNKGLSNQIANNYKEGYLEKLSIDSLLTQKNLQFIFSYPQTIRSQDQLFIVCYRYPEKVDSQFGKPEAMRFVNWLVTQEELMNKLVKDKKPIEKGDPDWRNLEKVIHTKYPKLDASILVNNFCIIYYRYYDLNWSKWAHYKNIRLKQTHLDYNDWLAISSELNDGGAWDVFMHCNEKSVLKNALDWINLAIQLEDKRQLGVPNEGFLDTKANILYKLGEVNEAITVEQDAIQAALKKGTEYGKSQAKSFEQVLEQMKAGEPTYINIKNGAVWDERTLPLKSSSYNLILNKSSSVGNK